MWRRKGPKYDPIEELGPLFKLTRTDHWDSETRVEKYFQEKYEETVVPPSPGIALIRGMEEVTKKMEDLGLPYIYEPPLPIEEENPKPHLLDGIDKLSSDSRKYYIQRYSLFSLFDEGIEMDDEAWYSVTPEILAKHHADRCCGGGTVVDEGIEMDDEVWTTSYSVTPEILAKHYADRCCGGGTVVDCFTGVGGNTIQFAKKCRNVIAIDIDNEKIAMAKHNAAIYNVADRIDFRAGDSRVLTPALEREGLEIDAVFMSPPWGGVGYKRVKVFDLNTMLLPCAGYKLFNMAKKITPKVVMYLPGNSNIDQLAEMALSANPPWSLEVERNYLNGVLKGITAYLVNPRVAHQGGLKDAGPSKLARRR